MSTSTSSLWAASSWLVIGPGVELADGALVHHADGDYAGARPGEENFVGGVDVVGLEVVLDDGYIELFGYVEDDAAGYAL